VIPSERPQNLVVDIDGTICTSEPGNYRDATPFPERIATLNALYDTGVRITYFTARGMGRYRNSVVMSYLRFYLLTRFQLKSWGAKFHSLRLGKPAGDQYVDDRARTDIDFFHVHGSLKNNSKS
jgi:hypothetical protein